MLKKTIFSVLAVFIISGIMALAGPASVHAAAVSKSKALLDWGSFEIILDSGMSLTWIEREEYVDAYADDDYAFDGRYSDSDYDDTSEWSWGETGVTASTPYAEGSGWTTTSEVGETVWALADGSYNTYAYADALAKRWVDFEISGSGYVTVNVDYSLDLYVSTDRAGDEAYAYASSYIELYNYDTVDLDYDKDYLDYAVYDGAGDAFAAGGTLTLSVWFNDGEYGGIYATVDNRAEVYSPIPEPSTMLLLGSGLLAVPFIRRMLRSLEDRSSDGAAG